MDLEFLWHLIQGDVDCRHGAAERLWKEQNRVGEEGAWRYLSGTDRNATRRYPKINDPAGLLRSLHSARSGPGMRTSYPGGANP